MRPADRGPAEFQERLLGTLRALGPVLAEPGVMIVGSEVPNLLSPNLVRF